MSPFFSVFLFSGYPNRFLGIPDTPFEENSYSKDFFKKNPF